MIPAGGEGDIPPGGRTALARAEIVDQRGRLLAEATSSCLILRP